MSTTDTERNTTGDTQERGRGRESEEESNETGGVRWFGQCEASEMGDHAIHQGK